MDLNMPIMNGFEATKLIKEFAVKKNLEIKVIGTTANEISQVLRAKCK